MEKIGGAYRRLGKQISDASKNDDSLQLIANIRTQAEAAAKLQPEKTADVPADEQAKFVANYQTGMKNFLADLGKLETALKAGKNEDAVAVMKTLKADMDDSHKEFRKKKDRKKA
jgi:soluble cytochrome b562